MNPEIELLNEAWDIVKDHIPRKERVTVAEELLRSFESHIDMSEITVYQNEFDTSMKAAIIALNGDQDGDEESEDWE